MIETLKFVRAAVCKNDLQPTLTHFRLRPGTIEATNGALTIQAPFPVSVDCAPKASVFFKAVAACKDTATFTFAGGRLTVKSGRFKSVVPCADASRFPETTPAGERFPVHSPLLPPLAQLAPFMSTDDLRPWACGVQLVNNSAYATNNISIIEAWLPVAFPIIANIPAEAVKELLRLNIEPESVQAEPHQVTFNLPGGAWFCCKVLAQAWPDVQRIFDNAEGYVGGFVGGNPLEELIADVASLSGFTDDLKTVYFLPGRVSTTREGEPGTSLDNPNTPQAGAYRAGQIASLAGVAERVGFDSYPDPVPFFGKSCRGILGGVRY